MESPKLNFLHELPLYLKLPVHIFVTSGRNLNPQVRKVRVVLENAFQSGQLIDSVVIVDYVQGLKQTTIFVERGDKFIEEIERYVG